MTKRLAIVTSHPIQYQAPWFRALAGNSELDLEVFFCQKATPADQAGAGFGVEFDWDVPLFDGYRYRFLHNVARTPTIRGFSGLDTPEIRDIITKEGFDAVIVNGWHYKSAWQAIRACWASKTPVMVRGDSHLHTHRSLLLRAAKWPAYRSFIPRFDACLPVGKWSSEYFLHYGARPEKIFAVPHVVDEHVFAAQRVRFQPLRDQLRNHWRLDANTVVFLFAGKFILKKRPMDFVRAIQLAARVAPVRGLMVGDGPLRGQCEEFVDQAQVPVQFTGFLNQSEIVRAYTASDALVLPSDGEETWGLVVNEAMICGRPCIVTDHVGCGPDLIDGDKTGFVYQLGNVEALADVMVRCSRKPEELVAMGYWAQERVRQYSVSAAVAAVVEATNARRLTRPSHLTASELSLRDAEGPR